MGKLFTNSRRLDHIIRFLQEFFPNNHFEGVSRGLRLVITGEEGDDRPKSMLKVESEYYNYIINTQIHYDEDEDFQDSSATVENPSLLEEEFITQPLASLIQQTEDFLYEGDLTDIITMLFHDLKYGKPLEEREKNDYPYLLPLVSAYNSNNISNLFTLATKKGEDDLYLFDDKISLDVFKEYVIDEINSVMSTLKTHLGSHYPNEFSIKWQQLSNHNVTECFLVIDKYLDDRTFKRLAEYVDDEENYEKLKSLTMTKPFPVTRFSVAFTSDTVIISAPNKVIVEGEMEIDTSQMVSSYLIAREGYLPKDYALSSIQSCITDIVGSVIEIIVRDADIDSVDDLGDILF